MAQLTQTMFSINGNPIAQFSSFSLNQSIFDHHRFTLVCPAQAIDGKMGMFTSSQEMIGGTFGARISGVGLMGEVLFNGIVTGVETARFTGHHGDVIITGYSPTIVLDSGPHSKSWEKKTVKAIAQDVLKFFPQNLLEPKVEPLATEPLGYTVQYKETAFEFLQRLAAGNGEWLFWDGRSLVFGPPRNETKVSLVYGSTLSRFNVSLQTRPTAQQYMSWDYNNSQVYTSRPKGVQQRAGLNLWGEKVFEKAQSVYGTQPKQWNFRHVTNKKQQDDMATLRSAMESSKMVRFNGQSGHPGVAIGCKIEVSGNNVFSISTEGYGEYQITSINHYVDINGNYENDFTAIPSSIKVPPVSIPNDPLVETQSAIVTDNHDPQGLGRIRVKFHWMNGAEKTPWIRVTTPHAGGGKGMFFIPEIGEEVIVGFEGDSATKPYIIGAVYQRKANNSFGNSGNDVKALQTRSGNKVVLNDKDGSVFMSDKGGANMLFDGAGNATTNVNTDNTLNAGTTHLINVGAKEDAPPMSMMKMDAEGNVILESYNSIILKVGECKIVINNDGIEGFSGIGTLKLTAASGPMRFASEGTMDIQSFGIMTIDGGPKATFRSDDTDII